MHTSKIDIQIEVDKSNTHARCRARVEKAVLASAGRFRANVSHHRGTLEAASSTSTAPSRPTLRCRHRGSHRSDVICDVSSHVRSQTWGTDEKQELDLKACAGLGRSVMLLSPRKATPQASVLFILNETLGNQARSIRPREPNGRTRSHNKEGMDTEQLERGRTHVSDWNLPRDEV